MRLNQKQARQVMEAGRAGGLLVVEPAGRDKWRVLRQRQGSALEGQEVYTSTLRKLARVGWRVQQFDPETLEATAWPGGE